MTAMINYDKIKGLIYTEKSNKQISDRKYYFHVDGSCRKSEVASLIKKIFNVNVEKVNAINVKSKSKKFKGVEGQTSAYKKIVVTLKQGQSINFS